MNSIYFICPDINIPAGGVKQLYRQVDVLNKHGYKAFIVHGHKNFRVTWFKNDTTVLWHPIVAELNNDVQKGLKNKLKEIVKKTLHKPKYDTSIVNDKLQLEKDDIIVLPEFYGKANDDIFSEQKTIIYNQNCYYTFRGYGIPSEENTTSIYKQKRLQGVIVASEDAMSYMKYFLNDKPIFRVKYGIDNKVFSYQAEKKKQIAFMPRKLREDSEQVLNILNLKGALNDWKIVPIQGMNEQQVAQVLKESAIFLSFNYREGFGMPPTEAMSCGCIVVGYTGQGGTEYFLPEITYKVPERNILVYSETLEDVVASFEKKWEAMIEKGAEASKFIEQTYNIQQEEESILTTWKALLKV